MELLVRQECAWHSDRPSRAICMSCRKSGCEECTTQSDGIHYCYECLPGRQQVPVASAPLMRLAAMVLLSLLFVFAIMRLAVGLGAALAMGFS